MPPGPPWKLAQIFAVLLRTALEDAAYNAWNYPDNAPGRAL